MYESLNDIMTIQWIWRTLVVEWWPLWTGITLLLAWIFVLLRIHRSPVCQKSKIRSADDRRYDTR